MPFYKPRHIVFEGGDGTGKDTQLELAKERAYEEFGIKSVIAHDSTKTEGVAGEINGIWLSPDNVLPAKTKLLLVNAARSIVSEQIVIPALQRGDWVFSNRSWIASVAYQGIGDDLGVGVAESISKYAAGENYRPDLTLFYAVDNVEESVARFQTRAQTQEELDVFERRSASFHEKVQTGYLEHAVRYGAIVVPASQTIEQIHQLTWDLIEPLIEEA